MRHRHRHRHRHRDRAGYEAAAVHAVLDEALICHVGYVVDARSQFHHSMNYRSVVVRGSAVLVEEPAERERAMAVVVEHVVAGRAALGRGAPGGGRVRRPRAGFGPCSAYRSTR